MAPGIKVRCTVYALAQRVLGSKRSKQRYGSAWKTKELRGSVTAMIRTGRSQKWECHFEQLSMTCALSARSLKISGQDSDTLPPQQPTAASVNEQLMTGENDVELDDACSAEDGGVDGEIDDVDEAGLSVDDENGDDADLNNDEMQQEESTVQEGQESNKDDPLNCNGVKWSVVSNVLYMYLRIHVCNHATEP